MINVRTELLWSFWYKCFVCWQIKLNTAESINDLAFRLGWKFPLIPTMLTRKTSQRTGRLFSMSLSVGKCWNYIRYWVLPPISSISFWTKYVSPRDSIGDTSVAGDKRWAGSFGVNVDFVARNHCSVEFIPTEDILVRNFFYLFWPFICLPSNSLLLSLMAE